MPVEMLARDQQQIVPLSRPIRRWLARHAGTIRKALLGCGVAYGVATIVADDAVAARIYHGSSRLDQAISELSATKAPSKDFLTAIMPVFSLLVIGFGAGVWQVSRGSRALRVTGAVFVVQGALVALLRRELEAEGRATQRRLRWPLEHATT